MTNCESYAPLLGGELGTQAQRRIDEIAAALLLRDPAATNDFSVSGGAPGLALFHHTYAKHSGSAAHGARAEGLIERCVEALAEREFRTGLFGGFSGIALVVETMGAGDGDTCASIDDALLEATSVSPYENGYDVISGLAGIGTFAVARFGRGLGDPLLRQVVDRLAETAARLPDGLTWMWDLSWTPEGLRKGRVEGEIDVGVAHGAAGVIPLLAAASALLPDSTTARETYEAARGWLLAQRLSTQTQQTQMGTYPAFVRPNVSPQATRVAWCYGDVGISAALLASAAWTNDRALAAHAVEVASLAARRPLAHSGLDDAALCHGIAGVAHCFHRIFRATGVEEIRDRAVSLFAETLDWRRADGIAGYQSCNPHLDPMWRSDPGVLEGAAGIGLALLSALGTEEPAWDAAFAIGLTPSWHSLLAAR